MPKDIDRRRRMEIALDEVRRALEKLRYGSVTVTVQDGIVIQIEATQKQRVDYSSLEKFTGSGEGI